MNPKISFLALLKKVDLSDQTFYPKDKKELGEDMIGTIKSELIKKIYIKWEQAREAHWKNHRQIGELAKKTLILVSERNAQLENLKKEHALLVNQEKLYEQLFWAMVRLEIPTPYNTIGIREKWQVVGIIADGGKDENYLPDALPLSAELEKISLDGNDPLAKYPIDEGKEVLGEIADDWLKKIFVILDQTSENLQVIKNQLEALTEERGSQAKKTEKFAGLIKNSKVMLKRSDLLRNIFWSATELACLNQFQFNGDLGIRSGWLIVKSPDQLEENPQIEAGLIPLLADIAMDLISAELAGKGKGRIHIIEIGIGRN